MNIIKTFFCTKNFFLVLNLVFRNLKLRYRKSVFGFLWTLFVPLLTSIVYIVVFKFIMRIKMDNYDLFIIGNIIHWTFVSSCILDGMESVLGNYNLLSKVAIPFHSIPLALSITHFINLLLAYPVLFGLAYFHSGLLYSTWFVFPFLSFFIFLFCYSLATVFSVAFIYYRDMRHLLGVLMQVWMYATPILYPISYLPEKMKVAYYLNPISGFFVATEDLLMRGQIPTQTTIYLILFWTSLAVIIANLFIHKFRKNLVEVV